MKRGISTTEFWVTVLVLVFCGVGAVYAFRNGTTYGQVAGVVALLLGLYKAHQYAINRVRLKLQELWKRFDEEQGCPQPAPTPAPAPTPVPVPTDEDLEEPTEPPLDEEPLEVPVKSTALEGVRVEARREGKMLVVYVTLAD
jgi:hypothetical protein